MGSLRATCRSDSGMGVTASFAIVLTSTKQSGCMMRTATPLFPSYSVRPPPAKTTAYLARCRIWRDTNKDEWSLTSRSSS